MSVVPIAVSRLGDGDSREAQNARAVQWLLAQPGGSLIVVTPRRKVDSPSIERLIAQPGARHHAWRGFSGGSFDGNRVLYAWPDRERLNNVWNVDADAIAVIEWGVEETSEWVEDVNPLQLLPGQIVALSPRRRLALESLPNGVDAILGHVAAMAAGYSSGLKWNEEDKLKADMMNRPDRWAPITVDQIRAKCRQLGMRADDVDTITDLVQRRKDGRRFNVGSSYRTFQFSCSLRAQTSRSRSLHDSALVEQFEIGVAEPRSDGRSRLLPRGPARIGALGIVPGGQRFSGCSIDLEETGCPKTDGSMSPLRQSATTAAPIPSGDEYGRDASLRARRR